jgi:pyruvate kinase
LEAAVGSAASRASSASATSDPAVIERIFNAGVDVFRLNFSHGVHEDHRKRYDTLRALEEKTGRPIAVLADLQGPKLRVGRVEVGLRQLHHERIENKAVVHEQ